MQAANWQMRIYSMACMVILAWLLFLPGCLNLIKGEFYLSGEQYEKGKTIFAKEVVKEPDKSDNWYYMGRFLLAEAKYADANAYFKKAVALDSSIDKYHFWLGVSYGGLNKSSYEIKSYQKAIELNPKYNQAHTYLGHSYFRKKQYKKALKSYERALSLVSGNHSALYNSALILHRTQKYTASKEKFKRYVNDYGYSPKAIRAVTYLNRMGDFDYRIHILNKKRMVLEKLSFSPENGKLTGQSRESLQAVIHMLEKNKKLELHILAYEKNNVALAREKVIRVKRYLGDFSTLIKSGQIKVSYFGTPEKIRYGKKTYALNSSINLFAVPEKLTR